MKAIKHSHYEQYLRLSNDDAALLVSSGRWVFVSKFEARKAIERQRSARPLALRIFTFVSALLAVVALLVLSTSARAADLRVPKSVPYKVCLTQAQATQVYPGKRLKYREVSGERCWYAGARLPKYAFYSRAEAKQTLGPSNKVVRARHDSAVHVPNSGFDSRDGSQLPHATGVAVTPARLPTQDSARVQAAPSGSIPDVGASLQAMAEDAFLALTGRPESFFTFDAYWDRMTGWVR